MELAASWENHNFANVKTKTQMSYAESAQLISTIICLGG